MENHIPERSQRLWRRKLSEAERAALRGQPELELEARLTAALSRLPNAPVPSNFTTRVLDAIELADAQSARGEQVSGWRWNWRALLPRVALAAALLFFAGLGYQRYSVSLHRTEIAQSLSAVASNSPMPSVDALENLDVIQRMGQSVHADTELLADLQ